MNSIKKISLAIGLIAIFSTSSFGYNNYSRNNNQRGQVAPPEAYTACEDKEAGDTASFTSPHGDEISGTCEQRGDRLVLKPDNAPGQRGGGQQSSQGGDQENSRGNNQQGPPPEAYTACEGKSAGDEAELKSPQGDTKQGTCVQQGDRLVLRPDFS